MRPEPGYELYFLFEDYALDTARRELRRSGTIVPLEPQVFDLLAFLIGNRDRVVSKDDLLASVWGGRIVSESTLGSRINAVRAAITDSGDAQRLIRTLPRKGFRFVGEVREENIPPYDERREDLPVAATLPAVVEMPRRSVSIRDRKWLLPVALSIATIAGMLLLLALRPTSLLPSKPAMPSQKFDPAVVPLLDSEDRVAVTGYLQQSEHKALAISSFGYGQAVGAPDVATAKTEALQRCGMRPQSACTLYAVDMNVVWPDGILPLPAPGDRPTEPLPGKLVPAELAALNEGWRRPAEIYSTQADHRALAVSRAHVHWVTNRNSRDEAVRLAVERCGYEAQFPCLVLSIDGSWTVEVPSSRPISNVFLPGTEPQLPPEQRQSVGVIYQGKPWRALAHGRNGTWHAVAGAASEAAAVEAALQSCATVDSECQIFAIGNFRVAEAK